MAKVKYNSKEINSFLHCSNNECGITIDHDMNGQGIIDVTYKDDSEGEMI